jgi:FtsH-binding integral membrane protein
MDVNPNQAAAGEASLSQTGSPQTPVQVENVQYGVKVGGFLSRIGLTFVVASTSLVILALSVAYALHGAVTVHDGSNEIAQRFIWLVSVAIPLLPLFIFTNKKLNMFVNDPVLREEITFKKRLRRALWAEIILAALCIAGGVYGGLSVALLKEEGDALDSFSSALFYGGAFALLALWSYSFQKRTQR